MLENRVLMCIGILLGGAATYALSYLALGLGRRESVLTGAAVMWIVFLSWIGPESRSSKGTALFVGTTHLLAGAIATAVFLYYAATKSEDRLYHLAWGIGGIALLTSIGMWSYFRWRSSRSGSQNVVDPTETARDQDTGGRNSA